jgi:hypothetical protein
MKPLRAPGGADVHLDQVMAAGPSLSFRFSILHSGLWAFSALVAFLVACPPSVLQAKPSAKPESEEVPLIGRKEPFCGAAGAGRFEVSMRAEPTDLQVGDSLALTVRIRALGSWQLPPQRPDLRRRPEYARFAEQFHVENTSERLSPEQGTWEFDYRLRPLRPDVQRIPSLPVVYYKPGLIPREKGFMTTDAPGIPLKVRPRAEVRPAEMQGATEAAGLPDRVYQFVQGPAVLRPEDRFALPGPLLLALLFLVPPGLCAAWYLAWRRLYPDAARLARQRRSRAAERAFKALRACNDDGAVRTEKAATVLTTYLRQRLDLAAVEPTPAEVEVHLRQRSVPPDLAAEVADFFRARDACRFCPDPPSGPEEMPAAAGRLILALEAAPCPPSMS